MQFLPNAFGFHVLALIMSIYMLFSAYRNRSSSKSSVYLVASFLLLIFYIILDFVMTLGETGAVTLDYDLVYYMDGFYMLTPCITVWLFYKYMGETIDKANKVVRIMMHSAFFLCMLSAVVIIASKDTPLFEDMTEGGIIYGPFTVAVEILSMLPFIILFGYSIYYYFNKDNFAFREASVPIIVFTSTTLLFGIIQIVFPTSSYAAIGIFISEAFLYSQSIVMTINNDELTGLFNRRQLLKDADRFIKTRTPWSLIMIDANSFKSINDEYGHAEGDRALKVISTVLESVVDRSESNAYRFAGDEFVILLSKESAGNAENVIQLIDNLLDDYNVREALPYMITVSSGYSQYDETKYPSIQDMLFNADKEMYKVKMEKKAEKPDVI